VPDLSRRIAEVRAGKEPPAARVAPPQDEPEPQRAVRSVLNGLHRAASEADAGRARCRMCIVAVIGLLPGAPTRSGHPVQTDKVRYGPSSLGHHKGTIHTLTALTTALTRKAL